MDLLVLAVDAAPRIELGAQRPGEEDRIRLADDDPPPHRPRSEGPRGGTSPKTTPSSSRKRPSRSAILAASSGFAETSPTSFPGSTTRPEPRSRSGAPSGGSDAGLLGLGDVPLDGEDAEHPLRADERAGDLVDGFCGRAQRQHEERGVPVEGDEVADVDLPREREACAEPRDENDEEPGHEDLGGVEGRLRQRNADACLSHLLRAVPVAVEERLLAADPAQHAQPGGGVRAESGQLPDLLPLLGLPSLERLDDRPHQKDEHGHADEDDEAERHRRGEQDDRDDDVRDDRPGEPRGDVERPAGAHRVVRDRRHDLAGRVLLLDRMPGAGGVVRDDLRHSERGLEPVRDRETVPHDSCHGRRRAEREQDQRPDRRARDCRRRRFHPGSRARSRPASAPARPSRARRRTPRRGASRAAAARPRRGTEQASACPEFRGRRKEA